jgi:hypothetical protein
MEAPDEPAKAAGALPAPPPEPPEPPEPAPPGADSFCRICLDQEPATDLIAPCSCAGTLAHAHESCLLAWARESGALRCEICRRDYAPGLAARLGADARVRAAAALSRLEAGGGAAEEAGEAPGARRRALFRALLFAAVLAGLLALLVFLGLKAGDAAWAGILLRVLALALPIALLLHAALTCSAMRRAGRMPRA